MSVTITIANNLTHSLENGTVEERKQECLCVQHGPAVAQCTYCGGLGYWVKNIYPCELNVSNVNFAGIWSALGLSQTVDSLDARTLAVALDFANVARIVRDDTQNGNYVDFGVSPVRAQHYLGILGEIATNAEQREERVIWY